MPKHVNNVSEFAFEIYLDWDGTSASFGFGLGISEIDTPLFLLFFRVTPSNFGPLLTYQVRGVRIRVLRFPRKRHGLGLGKKSSFLPFSLSAKIHLSRWVRMRLVSIMDSRCLSYASVLEAKGCLTLLLN